MEKYPEEVAILVAQTGPLNGQRWALQKTILIGRDLTCDIVIVDRQVSRHHARFQVTPEGINVEDLGSKNGTHHNGETLKRPLLLQDGDEIQIALAQKFVFLSSDATVPLEGSDIEFLSSTFAPKQQPGQPDFQRLRIDKRSRRVWVTVLDENQDYQEKEIIPPLSASQYRLLEALYDNQGEVVPRRDLVNTVWGEDQAFDVSEQALDALVRRLRDRIANVDPKHVYIITVRGHGLRLDNPTTNIE